MTMEMDDKSNPAKQNGSVTLWCVSTKTILELSAKLKNEIQDQVYELVTALKKREHELCKAVDEQCMMQLYEAETSRMFENDSNQNKPEMNQCEMSYLGSRMEFQSDVNDIKLLLQNYGQLKVVEDFDWLENSKTLKNIPSTESQSSKEYAVAERQKRTCSEMKREPDDPSDNESYGSTESFDVIEPLNEESQIFLKEIQILLKDLQKGREDASAEEQKDCHHGPAAKQEFGPESRPVGTSAERDFTPTQFPQTSLDSLLKLPKEEECSDEKGLPPAVCDRDKFGIPRLIHNIEPKVQSAVPVSSCNIQTTTLKVSVPQVSPDTKVPKSSKEAVAPNKTEEQTAARECLAKPSDLMQTCFSVYLAKEDPQKWLCPKSTSGSKRISNTDKLNEWLVQYPPEDKANSKIKIPYLHAENNRATWSEWIADSVITGKHQQSNDTPRISIYSENNYRNSSTLEKNNVISAITSQLKSFIM